MRHEKVYNRPDGSKVKINVHLSIDSYRASDGKWKVNVQICAPRKKTFVDVVDTNSWSYRQTPFNSKERENYAMNLNLQHCTKEEIFEAKTELWKSLMDKLKPVLE